MNDQDITRAEGILKEAKAHDIITKDITELDDAKKIKLANKIVDNARKSFSNNERGKQVTSILFAANVEIGGKSDPDEDEARYQATIDEFIESGLPIPPHIEGEPPSLPIDLTELADKRVRYLHGAFNACSARVGWLYALEEGGKAAASHIADDYEEKYLTTCDRKDIGGKAKAMALLKAEAKDAYPEIVKWRKRERIHSIAAQRYKRLNDIYNSNCERLSREWTMRINERESS